MMRTGQTGRRATAGIAACLAALVSAVPSARAQEGGVELRFDLSQRLEASDNLALDPDPAGRTLSAVTSLGFSLSSETRTERIALEGQGGYRYVDGPGTSEGEVSDPRLSFAYARTGATSALSVEARLSRSDIAYLRPLEDFVEDGVIVLPDDFEDLEGEGTRLNRSLRLQLTVGQEGPFGATVTARASDLRYRDTTAPDLADSRRAGIDADLRFALADAAEAVVGLGYEVIETDDAPRRETMSLDLDLSLARPRGALSFALFAAETDDGRRYGLETGRSIDLPRGEIAFALGATREATGGTALTGSVSVLREMPDGAIRLEAERRVVTGDEGERIVSTLSADYSRELTPLLGLQLDGRLARSEDSASQSSFTDATLGASLDYALADDWSLTAGYRARWHDETGLDRATENSVFLSVSRSFSLRP